MRKVVLTIAITAHTEGPLAEKTIKSVFLAITELEKQGITYEIIINIDRGDKATYDYFTKFHKDSRFIILESDFGDLGLSRNHILSKSHGEIISFLDADDLISKNWYLNAFNHIKSSNHSVVVHPKSSLLFGPDYDSTLCLFHNSTSKPAEALIALGANRWISTAIAKREIFEDTPYIATENGYGHEDYTFNLQTIAKDIAHETAKNTVHFYRQRPNSLVSTSNNSHATQPYTDLFDIHYLNNLPPVTLQNYYSPTHRIPPLYVQKAIKEISPIEPLVKLTKDSQKNGLPIFNPDTNNSFVRPAFLKLITSIVRSPEKVIIVGSASGDELKKLSKSSTETIVIVTDSSSSIPKNTPNATYLNFCEHSHWLNPIEKDILLTRLLIQLRPESLQVVDSKYGKTWISNHKDLDLAKTAAIVK